MEPQASFVFDTACKGTANDRTLQYSLDDHAHEIATGNGKRTRYWYGPDGQRYKREDIDGTKTLYIGQVEVVLQGAVTKYRRNIGGVLIQTVQVAVIEDRYQFTDRLGSVVKYTDGAGAVIQSQDYDEWGQRRDYDDPQLNGVAAPSPTIALRGYTGHEMVDGQDVVNMNARMFDPMLGRFLQADPLVQAPENLQSWNAYTYVFNNPLTLTDPTGMFSWRKFLGTAIGLALSIWTGGLAAGLWTTALTATQVATMVIAGSFAAGAIATGTLKGGLIGAFSALVSFGIAANFSGWAAIAAQAVSGGITEILSGGNFGNGFLAAGLTAGLMPNVGRIGNVYVRATAGAILGGSISKATGGKFINGAISGAVQGAMAGAMREQQLKGGAAAGIGDGAEGAPEDIARLIRSGQKQEALVKMMESNGMRMPANKIEYIDRFMYDPETSNLVHARAGSNGVITFYKSTFSWNYSAALSVARHEYIHILQLRSRGFFYEKGSVGGNVDELVAYTRQVQSPEFLTASPQFQLGTLGAMRSYINNVRSQVQVMRYGCTDISYRCN